MSTTWNRKICTLALRYRRNYQLVFVFNFFPNYPVKIWKYCTKINLAPEQLVFVIASVANLIANGKKNKKMLVRRCSCERQYFGQCSLYSKIELKSVRMRFFSHPYLILHSTNVISIEFHKSVCVFLLLLGSSSAPILTTHIQISLFVLVFLIAHCNIQKPIYWQHVICIVCIAFKI